MPWRAEEGLGDIFALKPITFVLKDGPANEDRNAAMPQHGRLADDIAAEDPKLAIYDQDMHTPKSYRQEALITALVGAVQTQQKQISDLKVELRRLEQQAR